MSGNRNYAWMVIVPNDDMSKSAVLSAKMLRKNKTAAGIIALVSASISKETIGDLNEAFDLVIIHDTGDLTKNERGIGTDEKEEDLLLVSATRFGIFSRIIVLAAGVLLVSQQDQLFDDLEDEEGANPRSCLLMMDKSGFEWRVARVTPDERKFAEKKQALCGKGSKRSLLELTFDVESNGKGMLKMECEEVSNLAELEMFQGNRFAHVNETSANEFLITMAYQDEEYNDLGQTARISSSVQVHENESTRDWVAIVGMACRFPDANSVEEYWDVLDNERNTCSMPPAHRLSLVDMNPDIKANFLKCPIDQFDTGFFGISPNEATFTDPQARLLLETSWTAFENAGINPEILRGTKAGVFYGSWLQEYKEALNDIGSLSPSQDFIRKYLGNAFGSSAARLSFFYGFTGPNVCTESGCSSSMVAVDIAVKSLQRRECPTALVCGANLILYMTNQQKLWAADGKCKTFDAEADGYARSEGIAVLVLKRYSDAIRDGDNIQGIIRGSATSQEGLSKSFGTPTVESECSAMRGALDAAKLEPNEVHYVEAHATGTSVGDPIEAAAIVKAYFGGERSEPLLIGSGKTNMGHSESCSGMAGIIKVVLAMQKEKIPKHLNVSKVNPQVDFSSIPGEICLKSRLWPRKPGEPRIAGVSSFGITGTDVHVIIQEAPNLQRRIEASPLLEERVPDFLEYLLTLSAKSDAALEQLTNNFRLHLENTTNSIEDISFTANACRPHHPFRKAVMGRNKTEMVSKILTGDTMSISKTEVPKDKKICFSFPGKIGNANLSSFRNLYETESFFRKTMDDCDAVFKKVTGSSSSLITTLFHCTSGEADNDSEKFQMDWYVLFPTCQYSLAKLWVHWGITPNVLLGHCFGELSALLFAGAVQLDQFYKYFVQIIPYFFQDQQENPATMMAINTGYNSVQELTQTFLHNNNNTKEDTTSSWIDVTCINSSDQTVVAGPPSTIEDFREFCQQKELRCKIIPLEFCAHSRAVEPACQKSIELLNKMYLHPIHTPYVSSATGKLLSDSELSSQHLYNVLRHCIKFSEACETVKESGLGNIFLEIGCDASLTKFTMDNCPRKNTNCICLPTFPKPGMGILTMVGGLYALGMNLNWTNFYSESDRKTKHLQRVQLPNYPFQRKSFWYERKCASREQIIGIDQPCQGPIVHPFLGVRVDTQAGLNNSVVFQNDRFSMMLDHPENTRFIGDHVIGTKVIFPGAGFLEMMMSAWKLAMETEISAIVSTKCLKIQAPLLVDQNAPKRVQCVVNTDSQTVAVYSSNGSGSPWTLHASLEMGIEDCGESINTDSDLEKVMNNFEDDEDAGDGEAAAANFYAAVSKVGLNFGTEFKSIKCINSNPNGDILVQVASSGHGDFLCHPILIDAMIQAFMVYKTQADVQQQRLRVPVQVAKFTLLSRASTGNEKWYVHCKNGSSKVTLFDQNGTCVAIMDNPELVATSVESVLRSAGCVNEDENLTPVKLYDVIWERSRMFQRDNGPSWKDKQEDSSIKLTGLQAFNEFSTESEAELDQVMNRLCYLYVVKALFALGWTPEVEPESKNWDILPGLKPAFKHYLTYLVECPVEWAGEEEVDREIENLLEIPVVKDYPAMATIHECGFNLAGILKGTLNPSKILFDDRSLADHYYQTSRFRIMAVHGESIFKHLVSQFQKKKKLLRILEVGAGTGAVPKRIISVLNEMGMEYEYHFTDISSTLINKAVDIFSEEDKKRFVFKTLNLEVDPLSQGFPPEYFDLIIAFDVLHATKDLHKTLGHISMVTQVGGMIFLGETEKPVREVDICFGILEGYWLFEDGIRNGHCTLDSAGWLRLLAENGFGGDPNSLLFCNGQMSIISAAKYEKGNIKLGREIATPGGKQDWIIFHFGEDEQVKALSRQMETTALRRVTTVHLDGTLTGSELEEMIRNRLDTLKEGLEGILIWTGSNHAIPMESRSILDPLLCISQYLLHAKMKVFPRLCLVTEGCWRALEGDSLNSQAPVYGTAWGFMRNVKIELRGILSKCIDLELDTLVHETSIQIMAELWLDDKEPEVVYRDGVRHLRRLKEDKPIGKTKDLMITEDGEFQIELPNSKLINDLKFVPMSREVLGEHQVKVEIRCVSLNFKDVLAVMKPSKDFEHLTSIGLDFAGEITEVGSKVTKWKAGDAVFGCEWERGCMRSHVTAEEKLIMAVPPTMTFAEAATLPAVFFTAWHCMVNVAKLQKGQTILVHAASGGVGLAAIQIAKLIGIRVIGTAGNDKKRKFLKSLGVEHVFNSRSLDFGQQIKKVTNGQGVDMVLNCLTGPGFKETSLEVCRDGGNFVEISKMDIWSEDEVKILRPLVKYEIVDVTQVDIKIFQDMMDRISSFLATREIEPLRYTEFKASRLIDALGFLQKAKQIGKVIVNMPRVQIMQAAQQLRRELLFNERSTYLITGGKGAIGFGVCKWMISQGAKYVVLLGRNEASEKVKEEIAKLEQDFEAIVICRELDISDYDQVKKVVLEITEDLHIPPLRGVHHCAGVLSDKLIVNQDWENFSTVFKPKVDGAWNLHRTTLSQPLDHFVLYSSAATTFGHAGQINYVSANAYLDHLAQYRKSINLSALSINWGKWNTGLAQEITIDWLPSFSLDQGISALDQIMTAQQTDTQINGIVVAGFFQFSRVLNILPHYRQAFLKAFSQKQLSSTNNSDSNANKQKISLLDNFKKVEDQKARIDLVREYVMRTLCETLGTNEDEITGDAEFSEMGMDSLMSIEFTNKIQADIEGCQSSDVGSVGGQIFIDLEASGTLNKLTESIVASLEEITVQ